MPDYGQKEHERRLIEGARRLCSYFPSGELTPFERPDWLLSSASVGIEVTELLPPKMKGALFSGPQLSVFQKEVVSKAEQYYYSLVEAPPADILAYFNNDWTQKRNSDSMAQQLAKFVLENYPFDRETVVLQEGTNPMIGWVDGLSVVRISRGHQAWQTGGAGSVETLTYEYLNARITSKNEMLQEYRLRLPRWEIWLMLTTSMSVLWSLGVPREVASWRFPFTFDKVLLYSWEDGVIELQPTEPNQCMQPM